MAEHTLQPAHADQLANYLRFLRRKRENAVAEVAAEFKEIRETRLFEESYTVGDVEDLLEGLLVNVRSSMKRDLQTNTHSSVLLVKQIFEQAEAASVDLHTDIPMTEDR